MIIDSITAIVKTFERPDSLINLIKSIQKYYPDLKVIVIDDSKFPMKHSLPKKINYFHTKYDIGTAAGRNIGIENCQSEYCLILDDDFHFTKYTNIERLVRTLQVTNFDIISGRVLDFPFYDRCYEGTFEVKDDEFIINVGNNHGYQYQFAKYDIVKNFFCAKTKVIKNIKWDPYLRLADHEDFFIRCKQFQLNITQDPKTIIYHFPIRSKEYNKIRLRVYQDRIRFKTKYNFSKITVVPPPTFSYFKMRRYLNIPKISLYLNKSH